MATFLDDNETVPINLKELLKCNQNPLQNGNFDNIP